MTKVKVAKPDGWRIRGAIGVALLAWSILAVVPAWGKERKFLVMLANSPKEFSSTGGKPAGGLINRDEVEEMYFDRTKPEINSFAEYWDEISYGDVQVTGTATGWINLPWPIHPEVVGGPRNFCPFG